MSTVVFHQRNAWTDGYPAPTLPQGTTQHLDLDALMFVHHSAGFSLGIRTVAEQISVVRMFWHYHVHVHGWADIGYSFVVFPPHGKLTRAHVYVGRGWGKIPAAQQGYNSGNWAACVVGNYEVEPVHPRVLDGLRLLRQRAAAQGFGNAVRGHRDVNPTSCPGARLYAKLGEL
jgi:hypothetical protein